MTDVWLEVIATEKMDHSDNVFWMIPTGNERRNSDGQVRLLLLQFDARVVIGERNRDRLLESSVVLFGVRPAVTKEVMDRILLSLRPKSFASHIGAH